MARPALPKKKCTVCGKEKKLIEFVKNSRAKSGYSSMCKKCNQKISKEYRANNPDKVKNYNSSPARVLRNYETRMMREYGLLLTDVQRMLEQQDHKCPICGVTIGIGANYTAVVDHCHTTGEIRGMLCDLCNRGLGHYQDSPSIMVKAAEYLKRTTTRPDEEGNEGFRVMRPSTYLPNLKPEDVQLHAQ